MVTGLLLKSSSLVVVAIGWTELSSIASGAAVTITGDGGGWLDLSLTALHSEWW